MEHLDLEFEVLTPAFLSGPDQQEVELRAASLRGELAWWWRTLQSGAPAAMRDREGQLFGSAEQGLKSALTISVKADQLRVIPRGHAAPTSGITYTYKRGGQMGKADVLPYLGYGPIRLLSRAERSEAESRGQRNLLDATGRAKRSPVFIRPAIAPGEHFGMRLAWRERGLDSSGPEQVVRAAASWSTLGGIGSRSRKGFGALHGTVTAASSAQLLQSARGWWDNQQGNMLIDGHAVTSTTVPAWPQLDFRRVHLRGKPSGYWQHALATAGLVYKRNRPGAASKFRWICGDADPRRASSVLLSVVRQGGGYRGLIALLPCLRDSSGNGANDMVTFDHEFSSW